MARTLPLLQSLLPAMGRLAFGILLSAPLSIVQAEERYLTLFADGERLESQTLPFWPLPSGNAKWKGRELFPASGPRLRLVRDRELSVLLRPPYLVMSNGDVLPGEPAQLEPGTNRQGEPLRLQVRLESPLLPVSGTTVSVRVDRIARIVGSESATARDELPAGTVILQNGKRLLARSVRWRPSALAVLTETGIVDVEYAELGDALLPGIDRLEGVLDDHRITDRDGACLARYVLSNGAVLTASRAGRTVENSRTRRGVVSETYYLIQPAWSSGPVKISEGEIAWCGYRAAHEVPLSLLPAETLVNDRLIGKPEAWQRNESQDGSILASGRRESDLGLAAHSHSEISFTLPPGSQTFTTAAGLDLCVQEGGCVRCRVIAEKADGKVLWDSGILRGSDEPKGTGPLAVSGLQQVLLVTDYAHTDRPRGADPLDIRDQVCWLEPLVQIDLAGPRKAQMLIAALTGARDWHVEEDGGKKAFLTSVWNEESLRWDPLLTLSKATTIELTRKLRVNPQSDVLELLTGCPFDVNHHDFELEVNGTPLAYSPSADRHQVVELNRRITYAQRRREAGSSRRIIPSDTLAYWWDLQKWRGQEVTLRLKLRGLAENNDIAWRGLSQRSAIGNLPEDGQPLVPDVSLTALEPAEISHHRNGGDAPHKDALPSRALEPIRFLGQRFESGYGMKRSSSLTFAIRPEYDRFVALAGCCESTAGAFRVLVDGKVLWERAVLDNLTPAEQIDLALPPGGKLLTLEIGTDGSYAGRAAWANAGFLK